MLSITQRQYDLYYNRYYYTGDIDGIEGKLLKTAYRRIQFAYKITIDGIYGKNTEAAVIDDAKKLQIALNNHGANLTVDGLVGNATIKAIKNFQKSHGLVVDGIAGTATWGLLGKSTWDNIKYFKRSEFACDCKGHCNGFPVEMNMELIELLDKLREHFGVPITITSGVRCKKRNAEVGGISNSEHLKGSAADIYVPGISRTAVKKKAYELGAKYCYSDTPGMGNAVHINV